MATKPLTQTPRELEELAELPEPLRFAFSPLVKRALGFACGALLGGAVFLFTIGHVAAAAAGLTEKAGETIASGQWLWLLAQYFYGYEVTWLGAFVGLFWGFWTGFVAGWFLAFVRNLIVAVWVFWIRARQLLTDNRDFLDHI
jgi:hypothetical protein